MRNTNIRPEPTTTSNAKPRDIVAKTKGHPQTLGITDETTACYTGGVYLFQGDAQKVCANAGAHRFWDGVHPTTKVRCSYATNSLLALHAAGLADGTATEDEYLARCRTEAF